MCVCVCVDWGGGGGERGGRGGRGKGGRGGRGEGGEGGEGGGGVRGKQLAESIPENFIIIVQGDNEHDFS